MGESSFATAVSKLNDSPGHQLKECLNISKNAMFEILRTFVGCEGTNLPPTVQTSVNFNRLFPVVLMDFLLLVHVKTFLKNLEGSIIPTEGLCPNSAMVFVLV